MLRLGGGTALSLALGACGDSEGQSSGATTGIPFPMATDTPTGGTAPAGGTGDKLDVAADGATMNAEDGGNEDGCEKVDFLFVIDSSRSMEDEQDNLLTSFPGFITAIEQTLEIDDFNLMVVDAGVVAGAGCDGTLGAGRVTSGSGQNCNLVGAQRYATADQPDLPAAFTCMGSRGFQGPGDEQTMDSLTTALGPLTDVGQCNEGFLRDDAILVVTIISDEEDSPLDNSAAPPLDGTCSPADSDPNSAGDPAVWRDQVVAAKSGDQDAVVVLSLIGDCDVGGNCPGIELEDPLDPLGPVSGAEPAPRLREFTQSFGFGSVGPVCADDYAPFFEQAVSVIESACDDFVPPA
ncbi:MAG: hypothetical protein K0V04_20835 [Deltaproteobacteria bacterium]|nr:hypothetical protein [Deltaproteobacteria bacterium]